MKNLEFSLYFHIPFCTKKCGYCHFYVLPNKEELHALLMEGLNKHLLLWRKKFAEKKIASIYFGGGTPSLLGAKAIATLLDQVHAIAPFDSNKIEITLEANPETTTRLQMQEYASAGINRVSLGVQSLDDSLLIKLGRTHHSQKAVDAIKAISEAGIDNLSIDLMYDIPQQTLSSWKNTLQQIAKLPITHLSLYNLTIEPHTAFFKKREQIQKEQPSQECSLEMYETAINLFSDIGLFQYEISAFARNGCYSRHNVGYWTARPFLGFGPSAFSYWEGARFRAISNLQHYVEALHRDEEPIDFLETLPPKAQQRELLAIALRLKEGVDLNEFEMRHGKLDESLLSCLKELENQKLIEQKPDKIMLTHFGMLCYDTVASEIIL